MHAVNIDVISSQDETTPEYHREQNRIALERANPPTIAVVEAALSTNCLQEAKAKRQIVELMHVPLDKSTVLGSSESRSNYKELIRMENNKLI